MINKKKLGMFSVLASSMAMMGNDPYGMNIIGIDPPRTETKEEKKQKLIKQEIEIAKGLKEFIYGENKLYSINQKNADKKAKKYGWI